EMMPESAANGLKRPEGHGIFFLRRNGSDWSLLSVTQGDISWENTYIQTPSSIPNALRKRVSAGLPSPNTPLDRVALELLAALEAGARVPFDLVAMYRESRSPVLKA